MMWIMRGVGDVSTEVSIPHLRVFCGCPGSRATGIPHEATSEPAGLLEVPLEFRQDIACESAECVLHGLLKVR